MNPSIKLIEQVKIQLNSDDIKRKEMEPLKVGKLSDMTSDQFHEYYNTLINHLDINKESLEEQVKKAFDFRYRCRGFNTYMSLCIRFPLSKCHWYAHNYWIVTDNEDMATDFIHRWASSFGKHVYFKDLTESWNCYMFEEIIIIQIRGICNKHLLIRDWLKSCGDYMPLKGRKGYKTLNPLRSIFIIANDLPENVITYNKRKSKKDHSEFVDQDNCNDICNTKLNIWYF